MRRIVSALAVAAATALLLTACAGGSSKSSSTATPKATAAASADLGCSLKPGTVTKAVTISGAEGSAPTISVPKGTSSPTEQRDVVTKGTGDKMSAGAYVVAGFTAYDATSGASLSDPFGWGAQKGALTVMLGDPSMIPGLTRTFGCTPVGSRVVYAAPAKVAFGSAATVTQNFSDGSVKAADEIVFVGDVLDSVPQKADGAPQAAQSGFPTVKLAKDGAPTVTIPKADPPTTTQIEVLKKGTGATVASGDTVIVQYQGTEWASAKIFDESWGTAHEKGGQAPAPSTAAQFQTTGVVKGFGDALVGQTVGSQVLVVIPPADGYADSPPQGQTIITKTSTLVFVIDILHTAASQ